MFLREVADTVPILKYSILKSHLEWYPTTVPAMSAAMGDASPKPKKT